MSCMLRASGIDFDVTSFLASCDVEPVAVFLKGTPRFPNSQPNGPLREKSGVNFEASPADFSELKTQFEDALLFMEAHSALIGRLVAFPGVEDVTLDFGAEIHPPGWYTFSLPTNLLRAAGNLGISLDLSVYPVQEEADK